MGRLESGGKLGRGALAAVFLLLIAAPALSAASPVPPAAAVAAAGNGSTNTWAYGASTWANATFTFPNGSLTVTSHYGWHVILTATNTSSTTTELEIQRTVGGALYADYCSPNCSAWAVHANLTVKGWEQSNGFVNITDAAKVTELNGSSVAAFGILNETASVRGNLTETFLLQQSLLGTTRTSTAYFTVAAHGNAAISFSPALGIVPVNLSAGDAWTSHAAYHAQGAWAANVLFAHSGASGTNSVLRSSPNGSVQSSGTLTLYGHAFGAVHLHTGASAAVVVIAVVGPFQLHEGLLLVPADVDLMSAGVAHPWDSSTLGATSFETNRVDVRAFHGGYLRVDAAESAYAGAESSVTPGGPMGVAPATSPAAQSGQLQAQPESPASAQQNSDCLVNGCTSSAGASPFTGVTGALLLAGLAVGALVVAGAIALHRRGRGGSGPAAYAPSSIPAGAVAAPPEGHPPLS